MSDHELAEHYADKFIADKSHLLNIGIHDTNYVYHELRGFFLKMIRETREGVVDGGNL